MSFLIESQPFSISESHPLACLIGMQEYRGDKQNNELDRFCFFPCNLARERISLMDRLLGVLERAQIEKHEPPPW